MPIISMPEQRVREVKCKTAPPINEGSSRSSWCTSFHAYDSKYPLYTIWECPDCGEHLYTSSKGSMSYKFWVPVRWHNFLIRYEIWRVTRAEDNNRDGVL